MKISAIKKDKKLIIGSSVSLLSLPLFFGLVLGYYSGKFYLENVHGKKAAGLIPIKSLVFNFGGYRIHLHHWLICSGLLVAAIFYDHFLFQSTLSQGILAGLIFHDIESDEEWYKVLAHQENTKEAIK